MTKPFGGPGFWAVERCLATIDRYEMVAKGDSVLVGVSGGPDSTCLLDVLQRVSEKLELTVMVGHIDHGLTPASEEVATDVARKATTDGLDAHVARARGLEGANLQARARAFRYDFFNTIAADAGANKIATGHTLDDRAETTVARLIHGAGTEVLAGIPPVSQMIIRPIIELRREETRRYCDECSLEFYDDPSNQDERFERVAVRKKVVSAIEEHWGSASIASITQSSERLREDGEALTKLAKQMESSVLRTAAGGIDIRRGLFDELPRALRRRLLQTAVGRVRDRGAAIDEVLDALDRSELKSGSRFAVAGGGEVVISKDLISVRTEGHD